MTSISDTMHKPSVTETPDTDAAHGTCENCGAALQGHYCHVCGQSMHSPVRSFAHAVEEVFESFWHLDGRIFRTLRDLMVPGRVAANYLAGQRVRYVQPLRLFVILSLLTFFVAHFAFSFEGGTISANDDPTGSDYTAALQKATTVEEAARARDEAFADLEKARREAGDMPLALFAINSAEAQVRRVAGDRIRELQARNGATPAAPPAATAPAPIETQGDAPKRKDFGINVGGSDWDPRAQPANVPWLPNAANAWLTRQGERLVENASRANTDREAFKDAVLRTVPSMLFVLVPVFALLLKVFYFFTRRVYLEHLVVALYSHAWLLLAVLMLSLSSMLRDALAAHGWATVALGIVEGLLWTWMPIYLLLMQKRAYGQSWWLTLPKYLVLGTIYLTLLSFAVAMAFVIGLVRM